MLALGCPVIRGYVLDGARRCVTRPDGSPLALTPRLFNALYLFASRPGELIDKRELMRALVAGAGGGGEHLSQLISRCGAHSATNRRS